MIKKGARSEDVVLRGKVSQPLLDLEDRFESALPTRSLKGNDGSLIASTAATTVGKYSGRHPAITAFAAMPRSDAGPFRGGITAMTSSGSRSTVARNRPIRSGVGGITGRPSVHRFS